MGSFSTGGSQGNSCELDLDREGHDMGKEDPWNILAYYNNVEFFLLWELLDVFTLW